MRGCSNYFFLTSFLLALFGVMALRADTDVVGHGDLQLGLAVLMAAAGIALFSETMVAAVAGLAAAGITLLAGVIVFIDDNMYLPGSILAFFALLRIADRIGRLRQTRSAAPSFNAVPVAMAPRPQVWVESGRPAAEQVPDWRHDGWNQPR